MPFRRIAVLGGGAWGTALALTCRARRARRHVVGTHEPGKPRSGSRARKPAPAGRASRRPRQGDARAGRGLARSTQSSSRCRRKRCAAVASSRSRKPCRRFAADRLRQRHRARHRASSCRRSSPRCAPDAVPAILSGPSFAADVARGLPTAVTMAAADGELRGRTGAGARLGELPSLSLEPTCAGSRSAAPPRTCWRSPPASSPDAGSGRARRRRSPRAALPNSCASVRPMALGPRR